MNRESREYLRANPDGKGYTEAMTGKYKELRDAALERASIGEVRDYISLHSKDGLLGWSNKAFKTELELSQGAGIEKANKQLAIYCNQIRVNPDLYDSLTPQYMSVVENLRDIAPLEYEKIKTKAVEDWVATYCHGRIDKNPHQALDMLKGGTFNNDLSPDAFNSLLNRAQSKI